MSKAQPPARTSQSSPASAPRPVINVKFEVIKPPRTPRDKVRYLDVDGPSPVARAEKQLQQMNVAYPMWLEEDRKVLWDAWQALRAKPHDTAAFLNIKHCKPQYATVYDTALITSIRHPSRSAKIICA